MHDLRNSTHYKLILKVLITNAAGIGPDLETFFINCKYFLTHLSKKCVLGVL